jgi:hypothetical protein
MCFSPRMGGYEGDGRGVFKFFGKSLRFWGGVATVGLEVEVVVCVIVRRRRCSDPADFLFFFRGGRGVGSGHESTTQAK